VDEEQLVLINSKGEMVGGFPLSGTSEFDILNKESNLTVVGQGSGAELIIQPIQ
jgi:hypothetical protein